MITKMIMVNAMFKYIAFSQLIILFEIKTKYYVWRENCPALLPRPRSHRRRMCVSDGLPSDVQHRTRNEDKKCVATALRKHKVKHKAFKTTELHN